MKYLNLKIKSLFLEIKKKVNAQILIIKNLNKLIK